MAKILDKQIACGISKYGYGGYNNLENKFTNNIACVIYSCLTGLILSSGFFLWKPASSLELLSESKQKRLKVLLGALFCSTVAAIVGVLNLTTLLFYWFMPIDVCPGTPNRSITGIGLGFVIASFILALYCMDKLN